MIPKLKSPTPPLFIGTVAKAHVCAVTTEVTVDSAADESVCPADWGDHFGLQEVEPERRMSFFSASGSRIQHHGSRKVIVNSVTGQKLLMNFQVTDVQKPLLAVSRLVEQGNLVQFGKAPGQSFIQGNRWVIPGALAPAALADF